MVHTKNYMYFPIFTNKFWFCLHWPPVNSVELRPPTLGALDVCLLICSTSDFRRHRLASNTEQVNRRNLGVAPIAVGARRGPQNPEHVEKFPRAQGAESFRETGAAELEPTDAAGGQ